MLKTVMNFGPQEQLQSIVFPQRTVNSFVKMSKTH